MNKYQNGKIYQIVDVGFNKCYVGSTTETLSQRMARHREHYRAYLNGTIKNWERSMMLFDEFGLDNCKILLIKNFACESRAELEREEGREILNNISNCVNKNVVGRTREEYYNDKRDILLEQKKEHRINNIEQYKEKDKKYHEENKEKRNNHSREWYENNKDYANQKSREYREKHGDELREKDRQKYHNNKEQIQAKRKVKTQCGCGGCFTSNNKAQHLKTKKHLEWLKQQELEEEPLQK